MSLQGLSLSLKTVTSETVITSEILPTQTEDPHETWTHSEPVSFTEITITTVIVLSIPVSAAPVTPAPNSVPPLSTHLSESPNTALKLSSPLLSSPSAAGSQEPVPLSPSSGPSSQLPSPTSLPSELSSSPSSSPSSSSTSSSSLFSLPSSSSPQSLPSSQASSTSSSSSPGSSRSIFIALATTLSLLAALVIVLGMFKCRRHLTRAKAFSPDSSQESIELENCSECPDPTTPSRILGLELSDTQSSRGNIDVYVAQLNSEPVTVQGDLPVGSISPFVKHYDSPASLSPYPDAAPHIAIPTKTSARPSGSLSVDVTHPVEQITEDGTNSNHQGLNETHASLSRTASVAHSTAPPPYSQIGEHVTEYRP